MPLDAETYSYLSIFYRSLRKRTEEKRQINKDSIITSLLEVNSNNIYNLLKASAIPSYKTPKQVLDRLVEQKLVRETDALGSFVITAEGIWEIESREGKLNVAKLLRHIDQKYFQAFDEANRALKDREKNVIFSMLAARTFSENVPVDLLTNDSVLDVWGQIIETSFEKLKSLGLISETEGKPYGKYGNEHSVSGLFRRMNDLPKITKGIYRNIGDHKYYLDVVDENGISKEKLSYLFKLVIGDKSLDVLKFREMVNFLCDVAASKDIYLFDENKDVYSKPTYDQVISDSLRLV